jgi:regulator of cell morphogenesis and NO signaling
MEATWSEAGIGAERLVNEVIRTHPATVEAFNRFGIDACCGGASSIRDAAVRDGADPEALLAALNEIVGRGA